MTNLDGRKIYEICRNHTLINCEAPLYSALYLSKSENAEHANEIQLFYCIPTTNANTTHSLSSADCTDCRLEWLLRNISIWKCVYFNKTAWQIEPARKTVHPTVSHDKTARHHAGCYKVPFNLRRHFWFEVMWPPAGHNTVQRSFLSSRGRSQPFHCCLDWLVPTGSLQVIWRGTTMQCNVYPKCNHSTHKLPKPGRRILPLCLQTRSIPDRWLDQWMDRDTSHLKPVHAKTSWVPVELNSCQQLAGIMCKRTFLPMGILCFFSPYSYFKYKNWNPVFINTPQLQRSTLISLAAAGLAVAYSVFAFLCGF